MSKLEYSKEDIIEMQNDIDKLQQENKQLKENRDKAIEYIKENVNQYTNPKKYNDLLKILKGE